MAEERESFMGYDWRSLRDWCLWYIGVFLEFSEKTGPAAYDWFRRQVEGRLLDWSCLKKATDISARYTVETITAQVSEALATRAALPGDFSDTVAVIQKEEALLRRALASEDTWAEICKIER